MKRVRKLTKSILLVGTAVAVAVIGAFVLSRSPGGAAAEPSSSIAQVERRSIDVIAEATGLVEPIRVVEVKSKASGEVLQVEVETGDRVERGTLLVTIDPRDVQSELDQAEADLESARVQLATLAAERGRLESLRDSGLVPQQEFETKVQAEAAARASLVRAETNLRLALERRQDVTIRAPSAGTIIERTVEPGQVIVSATASISEGTPLFRMADLTQMQVRAYIDEVDIGQVHAGQTARVSVEAHSGRTFVGEVAKIEPQAIVEQNVTLFPVLVHLANPQGLLMPGMNADVSIDIARRRDVVAVPNAALVSRREAAAAAAALGLDDMRSAMRGPGGGGGEGRGAEGTGVSEECQELVAKLRGGGGFGSLSAEDRARLRGCREQMSGGEGSPRASGREPPREARWSGPTSPEGAGEARSAVVFVQTPQGPEPRSVLVGHSDWEYTEVHEGLEAGERVVLVSVAQLQREQQEREARIRQRFGSPLGGR